ncbi:hypothetical protein OUZ56_003383 [Daphnia magna]|uniref:Uncharacterized protein n=1 Tax=Daphnia magna TaxID=35525 RepID=A0ABR0A8L4_9CRUS|nr:hypothetical protein OUZ56_003383 [Daphnia magna]
MNINGGGSIVYYSALSLMENRVLFRPVLFAGPISSGPISTGPISPASLASSATPPTAHMQRDGTKLRIQAGLGMECAITGALRADLATSLTFNCTFHSPQWNVTRQLWDFPQLLSHQLSLA